jgi:UDP-N-acetylglucosamine:LPS N-acetylglucosamine transferase
MLRSMSERMRAMGRPNASGDIADATLALLKR